MMKRTIWMVLLTCIIVGSGFAAEVLYSGELGGKGRSSALKGSWEIVEEDGERVLVLGKDFRARSGPDLKVFFSKLPLARIHDNNAGGRSHAIKIGQLKSSKGAQEYPLPDSLDLLVYKTWIVHCEAYAHFWDGAELDSAELEEKSEDEQSKAGERDKSESESAHPY